MIDPLGDSALKRIAGQIHSLIERYRAFDRVCADFQDYWKNRHTESKRLDLHPPVQDWPFSGRSDLEPTTDAQTRRMVLLVIYVNHTRFIEYRNRLIELVEPESSDDDVTLRRMAFYIARTEYTIPADDELNLDTFLREFEQWLVAENGRKRSRRRTGKPRHRPSDTDHKHDKRIHDAWKAARGKKRRLTYTDFAANWNDQFDKTITDSDVKAAVDRHAKRLKATPISASEKVRPKK